MTEDRAYDVRNFRAPVLVALAICLILIVIDVVMKSALGARPAVLVQASKHSAPLLQEAYERVAGLHVLQEASDHGPGPRHVLTLGLSTVRMGFDGQWLAVQTPGLQWLIFGGSGGSFDGLAYYSQPFMEDSTPAPELTIIGVHPAWAAGLSTIDVREEHTPEETFAATLAGNLIPLRDTIRGWFWSLQNDNVIGMHFESSVFEFKDALLRRFEVPVEQRYTPHNPPWFGEPHDYVSDRASQSELNRQLRRWTQMGMFDAQRYTRDGPQELTYFKKLLYQISRKSGHTVVVLLPEHPLLQQRLPDSAAPALRSFIKEFGDAVTVVDMRSELDPRFFFDYAHLNYSGQRQLSMRLLQHLQERGIMPD